MAWFSYKCKKHGIFKVSLKKREKIQKCPECGEECFVQLSVPSTQVLERLDNGAMVRAVERLHNIEEIMEERSKKDSTKKAKKELL